MDPIFDRLGRLIRSFGVDTSTSRDTSRRSLDPFQQEAEEELEEFLRTGRNSPKRPAAQGNRTFQEQRRQESARQAPPPPPRPELDPVLAQAFTTLGLETSAPWEKINEAHRALLKKHHPDRHAGNEALIRQATLQSQKINEAYQVLKKHFGR